MKQKQMKNTIKPNILIDFGKESHFKFAMLNTAEYNEVEESFYSEFFSDYPICEYEIYLIAKYMSNYGKAMIKKYMDALVYSSLDMRVLTFLRAFTYNYFKNIPGLQKYDLDKIEKRIDKLPAIQKMIKLALEKDGFVTFTSSSLASIPEYKAILKESLVKYVECLDAYIEANKNKVLKKSYYMVNLDRFLKLAGIKDKAVKAIMEYMLLCQQINFHERFPTDAYKYCNPDIVALGKTVKKEAFAKYTDLIFTSLHNARSFKIHTERYILSEFIYNACFTQYLTEEAFNEHCVPTLKQNDLTIKDFDYIPQVDYLASILKNALINKEKGINILLYGLPGTGKTALAKVLIKETNADGSEVPAFQALHSYHSCRAYDDDSTALNRNGTRIENFLLINRVLKGNSNAILLYDEAEDFFRRRNEASQSKSFINQILEENDTPTIWTMNDINCLEESFLRRFTYVLNVDTLPQDIYLRMITKFTAKYGVKLDEDTLNVYAQYKPSLGLIEKTLKNYVLSKFNDQTYLRTDIIDALKGQEGGRDLPKLVTNKFKFNPELLNTSVDLKQLTQQIKDNKRLDFSLLLYGVPGSSKTSFGRYLAKELGLKVINKNYTELTSCYVGETEKNIKALFEEAEKDKACIILDEADVLLRDRTTSKYSWEVSQTEALLTCMEEYPYPFIMTTNLFENLDAAVMRRVLYKVKHDYLTPEQVKIAFKYFFDIDITESLHLSRLASGDFALVKKQAEYQGKLKDKEWIIQQLTLEMNQKKESAASPSITI